ncbi:MAG: hypothetical protein HUJ78_04590, partial [Mogibacterium sp.]|nr:hypothetical protein [Mogibacterium sp.]
MERIIKENGRISFPIPEGIDIPWEKSLGEVPLTIDYFNGTMYEMVEEVANEQPDLIAFDFMGKSTSFGKMLE